MWEKVVDGWYWRGAIFFSPLGDIHKLTSLASSLLLAFPIELGLEAYGQTTLGFR